MVVPPPAPFCPVARVSSRDAVEIEKTKLSSNDLSSMSFRGCEMYMKRKEVASPDASSTSASSRDTDAPQDVLEPPTVPYFSTSKQAYALIGELVSKTPRAKGVEEFSSLHIVSVDSRTTEARILCKSARHISKKACEYSWPSLSKYDVDGEYAAFFRITSDMILNGADRASLLVFLADEKQQEEQMAVAAILGMLPFRGVQVAFVTRSVEYVDPLATLKTASGLFEYSATQSERMGRKPMSAIFGPMPEKVFSSPLSKWSPLKPSPLLEEEKPAPFKIGGLELPMVTYEGPYKSGIARFADLLCAHYGSSLFPVVAVGETGDALGYGSDVSVALSDRDCPGYYFAHGSSESNKKPEEYGKPELLKQIARAKADGLRVVVIAVGGGVNGNAMGMIAAMTGSDFIEAPTTLMHYNDATTSAKKAFSLVVDGKILSKNILGTFYLPQLVYCVSEVFLTLSFSSVHAAVGEAAKTMSMLGKANSKQGQQDFHNILGGSEFASDFTRIVRTAPGFEQLILFLKQTAVLKENVLSVGRQLREAISGYESQEKRNQLNALRREGLQKLRSVYHSDLAPAERQQIVDFLTVINEEVIRAKAMFLAYSDPFEKYRALLFEYAHTLGHGVEAFMNDVYRQAEERGIDCTHAYKLHGQCVGMAVIWAGEMSRDLGHLVGNGYLAHQSLVYLFNRFGGFDFSPCRELCDRLEVSKEEFCEGVLRVVRRDNKRGYCACAPGSSVDQLVKERPGCLLRSDDPSAELRYLVEVSEEAQHQVLEKAFDGIYDRILVLDSKDHPEEKAESVGKLALRLRAEASKELSTDVAVAAVNHLLNQLYDFSL